MTRGGKVVSCWGWYNGVDQYNVAINSQRRAVGFQPVLSSMRLNFPFGPPTPEGYSIDALQSRSITNLPLNVNRHVFDNLSISEASRYKLDAVQRINNCIYMDRETLLSLVNTRRGVFPYNRGIYVRVSNCDYHSFLRVQKFWINNLALLRVQHPFPRTNDEISLNGTTWRILP